MPDWRGELRRRLSSPRLSPQREGEIIQGLEQHLDDRYAELLARGEFADEAYSLALQEELRRSDASFPQLRAIEPIERNHNSMVCAHRS